VCSVGRLRREHRAKDGGRGGVVIVAQQLTVGLRGTKAEQEATTEARTREDKTFMAKRLCVHVCVQGVRREQQRGR